MQWELTLDGYHSDTVLTSEFCIHSSEKCWGAREFVASCKIGSGEESFMMSSLASRCSGTGVLTRTKHKELSSWLMRCSPRGLTESARVTSTTTIRVLGPDSHHCPTFRFSVSSGDRLHLHTKTSSSRLPTFAVRCSRDFDIQPSSDPAIADIKSESRSRGLLRIVAVIGSAAVVSKILGLLRETVLAAVFGVGPVINAFSYASIIPGFFLTLLGGINGPFHSAVAASLSKCTKEEGRQLVQRVALISGVICAGLSFAIFLISAPLVDAVAPGLLVAGHPDGMLTRNLAIIQLKVMAPCAMLAALLGIGFGSLSNAGIYGLPSLSPAISSLCVLVAVGVYVLKFQQVSSSSNFIAGAVSLGAGTSIGALAQWGVQARALRKAGFGPTQSLMALRKNPFEDKGVREVFAVLLPATIASGMLQIATYTDLYFASFIPGAAAGLGYANLLVMAPLGILSSSILVPMLSMFSRLSEPSDELELQERVKQGLLLSMVVTLLMTGVMVSLAEPVVRIVFQRRAFDASACVLVSSLVICYALGSTFYLARDLLVRAFYALGDGGVPFKISVAAICANGVLDWILVQQAGYGAQGLVLATSLVNFVSTIALLLKLSCRLKGLQLKHWVRPLLLLGCSAVFSGLVTKASYNQLILFISLFRSMTSRSLWLADLFALLTASGLGVVSYFVPLFIFHVPELQSVLQLLKAKL